MARGLRVMIVVSLAFALVGCASHWKPLRSSPRGGRYEAPDGLFSVDLGSDLSAWRVESESHSDGSGVVKFSSGPHATRFVMYQRRSSREWLTPSAEEEGEQLRLCQRVSASVGFYGPEAEVVHQEMYRDVQHGLRFMTIVNRPHEDRTERGGSVSEPRTRPGGLWGMVTFSTEDNCFTLVFGPDYHQGLPSADGSGEGDGAMSLEDHIESVRRMWASYQWDFAY